MKIREGFVSNSSSSSFIFRGIKITIDKLIENFNLNKDDKGLYDQIEDILEKYELDVNPTGNCYDEYDYNNLIVGKFSGNLNDGEITELDDDELLDQDILNKLQSIGLSGNLKTYIQMISNDNY